MGLYYTFVYWRAHTTIRLKRIMKLLLIFAAMVAIVGVVKCGSAPIYKRSPLFGLERIVTTCTGSCNQQKYGFGRALFASGALLGLAGIATNNEGFQRVGGAAAAGGLGLKAAANIFGGR